MNRTLPVLIVLAVLAFVPLSGMQGTKYGAGVTLSTATPIANIVADPKAYVGKTVRVDGVVTAVCEMAGCWMQLLPEGADPKTAASLRIKVDDGVIVFPLEAKGKKASAQGVFEPAGEDIETEHTARGKEEVAALKGKLAEMATKHGASHPDVVTMKRKIETLEKAQAEAAANKALAGYWVKATGAVVY